MPPRHLLPSCAALLLTGLMLAVPTRPATAAPLLAHRALYDLKLDPTKHGDVQAAAGTMAYEVLDTCDGWASRQRLKMTITNSEGQEIEMLSDYTTFETKDGLNMRFRMRQTTDDAVTSDVEGAARLDGPNGAGSAHYTLPHDATAALPKGTLFPTAHTEALLAAAEAGKKFITLPLFDGTTEKGAQDSSIAVINWSGPKPTPWPALSKLPSGKVHLAFFDRAATAQEPDYEVSMRYWANGVADDLAMDFGDFTMDGTLAEFTPVKPHC
jgi:hypothetical protein